jgi:hypothetical protein
MSRSDGSTADYYVLPEGATQLQDLISHRDMNSQIGEIFRACYRYGIVSHSDKMRDAKKIRFYAQAEVERLEKLAQAEEPSHIISDIPEGIYWEDADDKYEWLATDREGAFWFVKEPELKPHGKTWEYPGNTNMETIDETPRDLAKYRRPTCTAQ